MVTVGRMFKNLSRICCGGLRRALRKSLADEVACPIGSERRLFPLRLPPESAQSERCAEDAEVVVIHLISQPCVADLIRGL